MPFPTGIVTFLFTDVVGSTTRWERSPDVMRQAIVRHDHVITGAIDGHGGRVVKKMGDGLMAAFFDPAEAVACAVEAQRRLLAEVWDDSLGGMEVRMGIHTGPGTRVEEDYVGPTVNRAARIEAAGHGLQVLVSEAAQRLVGDRLRGVEFRALGTHHLRGLSDGESIFQVLASGLPESFPPLRTESIPTNVSASLRQIVGRDDEVASLVDAVQSHRLVTIVGAGGAGKTTLAEEVARRLKESYPAGVWLIGLAGLTDGSRIATEILGVIKRPAPADRDDRDVLAAAVQDQQMLLILDNCEHLLEVVTALVSRLLGEAPGLKIMATSREPMAIGGELVWQIPTLSLPNEDTSKAVLSSGAGELFATCARMSDSTFEVTEENAEVVAHLCRTLDGLPLAIELACARLRSMGLQDLSDRLGDRFKVLRGNSTDPIAHHRTLRDTVAWSYDLLSEGEQVLYRRLSPFAGGFDLDAAETVSAGVTGEEEVLDLLDSLVGQSLIQHHNGRYGMLETIRRFGHEMAKENGEGYTASNAHLTWLAELARTGGRQLEGPDQVKWLARFQSEIDNIRAGFGWAIEHDPVAGCAIAGSLTRFFWMNAMEADTHRMTDSRSFLAEGYEWSLALLDAAGEDLPAKLRARILSGVGGMLCVRSGRVEEGIQLLAEAQRIFKELDDQRGLGWALFYDGIAGWGIRSAEDTTSLFESSLVCHTKAEDPAGQMFSELLLGSSLVLVGRAEEGKTHLDRFDRVAHATRIPNAEAHADDILAQFEAFTDQVGDSSIELTIKAIDGFRSINNYACITHTLGNAGMILARLGEYESAGIAVGISKAVRDRLNMVVAPYEDRSETVWDILNAYGIQPSSYQSAITRGRTMRPDEGIDWVIKRLLALKTPTI